MLSEVENSVDWILMSKPASFAIACTTCAMRCASEVVGVISVKLGLATPAAGEVGPRHTLDEVELPRAEVGEAHRRVHDRQIDDAVEMDRAPVAVFREALEHDAVLRHALDKAERAGAHGPGAELVARGLR